MKLLKNSQTTFNLLYIPWVFGLGLMAGFLPHFLHNIMYANISFLILLILLFFIPPIKDKPQHRAPFLAYLKGFLLISLMQFSLVLIALTINIVFVKYVPSEDNLNFITLMQQNLHNFIAWGLFPWTAIVIVALALTAIKPQKNISIFDTLSISMHHPIASGIRAFLRQGLLLSIALIVTSLGLSLYFYVIAFGFPTFKFFPNGYSVIIFLLLFIALSSRYWRGLLRRLWHRNFTTLQCLLIQTLCTIVGIIILTPLVTALGSAAQVDMHAMVTFPIPHPPYKFTWEFLHWSFWLGLVVFVAPKFARIFKGKNLRIMIILGLFWPMVFAGLWLMPHTKPLITQCLSFIDKPDISVGFNFIVFLLVIIYLWFDKSFEVLFQQYQSPKIGRISKAYPLKTRIYFLRLMTLFLLFYILDGINLLTLVFFAMTASCFFIYLFSGLRLLSSKAA